MKRKHIPTLLEIQTDKNIVKIEIELNLLSMRYKEIESELGNASSERFESKVKKQNGIVVCSNKRSDFNLTFDISDYDLYQEWETKLGAYVMYNSLIWLKFGGTSAKISEINKRLNHRLLQVPKEALRFIRVDGVPLSEYDLKNSQPCLLMNMLFGKLNVPFMDYHIALRRIMNDYRGLKELYANEDNLYRLAQSAYQGEFYEAFQEMSQEPNTREEAKKATMFVLFSGFNVNWNPLRKTWTENHPEFYWFIQNLKRAFYKAYKDNVLDKPISRNGRISEEAYKASTSFLPVLLQKLEASIFLENILDDLFGRGIFALSKHDAILFKESDREVVHEVMEFHLNRILGKGKFALDITHHCKDCRKYYKGAA